MRPALGYSGEPIGQSTASVRKDEMSEPAVDATEEVRRLTELAEALRRELDQRQAELSAELLAITRMHEVSARPQGHTECELLEAVVDAIVAVQSADMAGVHLFDSRRGTLDLVADRGMTDDARRRGVPLDSLSTAEVLRRGERVLLGPDDLAPIPGLELGLVAGQMTPLLGAAGELLGVITTGFRAAHEWRDRDLRFTDLFARQIADLIQCGRATAALRRSEFYLSEGQRICGTGSWAWKVGTDEMFWSDEHFRIWGLDQGASQSPDYAGYISSIHPADWPRVRATFEKAVADGGVYDCEYRIHRPDGTIRSIHSIAHPVLDRREQLVEYIGTVVDVTERKHVEEAACRSLAYLAEGERMSHTGSWSVAMPGNTLFWSPEHYRIFGLEAGSEVTLDQALAMIHPEDLAAAREVWGRAVALSIPFETSFRVVRPDAGVRHVRSAGRPAFDETGTVTEFVGTLIDETERWAAESALARVREQLAHVGRVTAMGALTASIAHELNQPLAAIAANAQACMHWIGASPSNLEEASAATQRIVRDAKRASDVIAHIRTFLTHGKPVQSAVRLPDVVREVAALLAGDIRGKGVTLDCHFDPDLPEVTGDRVQLQQVVLNLVINAIESVAALPQPPRLVWIRAERDAAANVLVRVRDNGGGLEADSSERVFNGFYTTKPFGMGMGLPISRSIVEAHGGRLWAERDAGAGGATFSFTLAARAAAS